MRPALDDRDLLELHVGTGFVLTDSGRILHDNAPDQSAGPRLYLAGCSSGNVVRLRHDVGEGTARAIALLAADEPALHGSHSTPVHLDRYIQLLAAETPIQRWNAGLVWTFPDRLD